MTAAIRIVLANDLAGRSEMATRLVAD